MKLDEIYNNKEISKKKIRVRVELRVKLGPQCCKPATNYIVSYGVLMIASKNVMIIITFMILYCS